MTELKAEEETAAESGSEEKLLRKWLGVVESQICAFEVLSEQMPTVNTLLETEMTNLSEQFSILTKIAKEQEEMVIEINDHSSGQLKEVTGKIRDKYSDLNQAIGKIIMSMQFQDRVSQNIVINTDVMKVSAEYLEATISDTLDEFEHQHQMSGKRKRVKIDTEFAKKVIDKLWLGELRNNFVDHLLEHGYIKSAEEIGHAASEAEDDDVDLF